jgi:uncharacterized protein YecT (DUF1311 family)
MRRFEALAIITLAVLFPPAARAQAPRADPADVAVIESCLKQQRAKDQRGDACIGVVADPCLEKPDGQSTAGAVACHTREHLVWDDMLNRNYEQLRLSLEQGQWAKLRDAQRLWIEVRKRSCEFYWEFFRGTMASPMAESCYARAAADRALYLQFFVESSGKK